MLRALPVPRRNMAWVQTEPYPQTTHSHPTVLKNKPRPSPAQPGHIPCLGLNPAKKEERLFKRVAPLLSTHHSSPSPKQRVVGTGHQEMAASPAQLIPAPGQIGMYLTIPRIQDALPLRAKPISAELSPFPDGATAPPFSRYLPFQPGQR